MLTIAIFDQDKAEAMSLREIMKSTLINFKISFQITTFHSTDFTIQKKIEENPYEYDIAILHNNSDNHEFDIAQSIRKSNNDCAIIFISDTDEMIHKALQYRASAFFIKPINKQYLDYILKYILEEIRFKKSYFSINSKLVVVRIPYQSIDYFESQLRNVKIILNNDRFKEKIFIAKLCDVFQSLPKDRFVRCHQSYIINLENVKYLNKAEKRFTLFSGKEIDISKRLYPSVLKLFQEYIKEEFVVKQEERINLFV